MSEKIYPVRDPETIAKMQEAFSDKIRGNRDKGLKAFATGEYTPFSGFPDSFKSLYAMACELEQGSQDRIIEQVVKPLEEIADKYDVPAVFAGNGDLPPHLTLFNSPFKDVPPEDQAIIDDYLASNRSHINLVKGALIGLTFHMDTLVLAPNTYICASKFNDEQGAPYKARALGEAIIDRAKGVFERQEQVEFPGSFGFPYRWNDILHSSVARVTGQVPSERLLAFAADAYATIGPSLATDPIPLTVKEVYAGRAA